MRTLVRKTAIISAALGLFAALTMASASPASARDGDSRHDGRDRSANSRDRDSRDDRDHGPVRDIDRHRDGDHSRIAVRGPVVGRHRVVRPVVAPRFVHFRTVHTYDPFFSERIFFGPHRHYHAVYLFPVATAHGIVYEPYTYCGDQLFASGYVGFSGPRIGISLRF